jgi:prepilin-type N-terminal cleavage/methylation domain-containing protein
MRSRLFTLVELLTVMAIVGLLAGLLLPALSAARAKSRAVSCLSQLHQIGVALHACVSESGDCLPSCCRLGADPILRLPALPQALAVQAGDRELFHCPADQGAASLFQDVGTSYEWNTFINGRKIDRATFTVVGLEISAPLLGDAEAFHLQKSRNYLYPDGRAVASLELLIR